MGALGAIRFASDADLVWSLGGTDVLVILTRTSFTKDLMSVPAVQNEAKVVRRVRGRLQRSLREYLCTFEENSSRRWRCHGYSNFPSVNLC
jgi:hypothetical protein